MKLITIETTEQDTLNGSVQACIEQHADLSGHGPVSAVRVKLDRYITCAIVTFYRAGMKVDGIKLARAHYSLGLKEAKDLCDGLWIIYQDPFTRVP